MCRDRVDVDEVLEDPVFILVGLLFSYMVDDLVTGTRSRLEARRIGQYLAEHRKFPEPGQMEAEDGVTVDDEDQPPDPATWGLLPEHQAGLRAAVGATGGAQGPAMDSSTGPLGMWEAAPRE